MSEPLFQFFELPRELRDLIYHHLWQDCPAITVPYSGRTTESHYNPAINEPHFKACHDYSKDNVPLPPWVFANTTFFYEAISAFEENADWAWLRWAPSKRNAGSSMLFGPSTSKIVTLKLGEIEDMICKPVRAESLAKEVRALETNFSRIAEDMLACGQTQHLHITFDIESNTTVFALNFFPDVITSMFEPFQHVPIGNLVICVREAKDLVKDLEEEKKMQLRQGLERIAGTILGTESPESSLEKHWKDEEEMQYYWLQYKKADQARSV
jgi:hypothetical protein